MVPWLSLLSFPEKITHILLQLKRILSLSQGQTERTHYLLG
jgi:hypothetical protein